MERIKRRFLCLPKATCFLRAMGWAGLMYKNFTFQRIQQFLFLQFGQICPVRLGSDTRAPVISGCFPPHSCSFTTVSKTWKQQWQLYHSHHLWPIVSKVTVMLSSGLVDSHHASSVLSIPFTWLRHHNQWECSGFESSRNTAYMTVRPLAVRLYTCNSMIMFCGSESVNQWAVARCVLTSQNLNSCTFLFYYSCVSWIGCTMSNWEACDLF